MFHGSDPETVAADRICAGTPARCQARTRLHPAAIQDAVHDRERAKIDRYRTHLFMTAYCARLDTETGVLLCWVLRRNDWL